MFPKHSEKIFAKPKSFNQFHSHCLSCEIAFGCLIHTLTLLCTRILASVCISLIWAWINLSSLQLNSFRITSSSLGNEICSTEPTWFQKWFCMFSRFLNASFSEWAVIIIVGNALETEWYQLCGLQKIPNLTFSCAKRPFIFLLMMLNAFITVAMAWAIFFGARTIRSRHYVENLKHSI